MNNIHNMSPYIRIAMDSCIPFPWLLQERVLFDYEIIYLKEGKLQVTVEDRIYWGEPGDIFFFRPKQKHSIRKIGDGQVRQPHLHFDLFFQDDSPDVKVSFKNLEDMSADDMRWFRQDDLEHLHLQLDSHIRLRQPLAVENILFEIIREFQMKLPYFELNIKGLFVQLFTALIRETYWNRNPHLLSNMNELEQVRTFLKHNIGTKVTVDELAKLSGISKYYLITLFSQTFGMSPIQYHQLMRIEKARELIQFTDEPLKKIAEFIGFPDIHSFSKAFKKVEGVNPSFYRKKKGNDE